MTLLQIKIAMEEFFLANYSTTPIHFVGTDFNVASNEKWVYFEYTGTSIGDCGFSKEEKTHRGYVKLVAIAKNPFDATSIADTAIGVFNAYKVANMYPNEVSIVNQGYDKELGKSFIEIELSMSSL